MKDQIEVLTQLFSAYQKASYFLSLVKQALELCDNFLQPKESKDFRHYYHYLNNISEHRLSYWQNSYAQRVQCLLESITIGTRVLDAGCGLGTETILAGILGADVIGVDLSQERLSVACKRLKFYQQQIDKPINVNLYAQSVFDVTDDFDVIWIQQAISHIEPATEFIKFCREHLVNGGKLIITDTNALNPYSYLEAKREQKRSGGLYTIKENPKTGRIVPYVRERIFTIPSIRRMLEKNSFTITKVLPYGFLPYFPLFMRGKHVTYYADQWLGKVPLVRLLAAAYVITGLKSEQHLSDTRELNSFY